MSRSKAKSGLWELHARQSFPALIVLIAGIAVALLAWYWQFGRAPAQDSYVPAENESSVRLNELMSSNKSALQDDRGDYSDWIELQNISDQPADISGWKISDGGSIFTFHEQVLSPGECVVVFASGSLHSIPGEVYHAPFRLSASGETLTLTDAHENTVDTVVLPALEADTSYRRNPDGSWAKTSSFTPGLDNARSYQPVQENAYSSGLIISEVIPANRSYCADEDGEYTDLIELYNGSGSALSLSGLYLSDDVTKKTKWAFPDVTMEAGQYLIVHASGKDRTASELHTGFSLSADGEGVLISDAEGHLIDRMSYDAAETDISWSRVNGEWVNTLPPTPGYSNDLNGVARVDAAMTGANAYRVYINEAMASTRVINDMDTEASHDWVELYNASASLVDLSGWGLSDSAGRPRKWQFPQGATIGPGQYMLVYLSGNDTMTDGKYHTSFSLSRSEGEALTLCTPDGTIVDRMPSGEMYAEISKGRMPAQDGFFLFAEATPGAGNSTTAYSGRAQQVVFSEEGGVKNASFMLTMSAGEGETIYYTTDSTDPTIYSSRYTGPIEISSTTVVRAVAVKTGYIDSISETRTYLLGVSHTLPVVCMTSDPDGMFSEDNGLYTNFEEFWERSAYIEYYSTSGETLISQGAAVSLHGNDARKCEQKTFNVIARSEYGDNRFRTPIFPNRDYTEYQSFLLRPSSEDSNYSRMKCSILSSLLSETDVMYQDTVVAVLYINGQYWGHYNLRERINTYSVAQWEGWTDPDQIDLVKGNTTVKQGSNKSFKELLSWLKENSLTSEENMAYLRTQVDVENYLDYVMLQMYVSNSDLLNVKRYRSDEGDGKWRWTVFDLDWAFHNDTNSWKDWLGNDGCGIGDATDNTLFRSLMKNDEIKDYFLRLLGQRMATVWSSSVITQKIDERAALLEPEMPANSERWGKSTSRWYEKVELFRDYALTRPAKLISYIAETEDLTDAQVEEYFGDALRANPMPKEED